MTAVSQLRANTQSRWIHTTTVKHWYEPLALEEYTLEKQGGWTKLKGLTIIPPPIPKEHSLQCWVQSYLLGFGRSCLLQLLSNIVKLFKTVHLQSFSLSGNSGSSYRQPPSCIYESYNYLIFAYVLILNIQRSKKVNCKPIGDYSLTVNCSRI